jgi:hypothetical protein
MSPDSPLTNDSANAETSARPSSSSYGSLAKSIRSRTTDLLAIAVVMIAGMTLGRQVITWWHADDADPVPRSRIPAVWGSAGAPLDIRFGDLSLGMSRLAITGTETEAQRQLVVLCTEKTRTAAATERSPEKSELTLLQRLKEMKPVASEPGKWEIYLLERPMAMAVGVRVVKPAKESPTGRESGQAKVEQSPRRVVCWGWLMPSGNRSWNAYCLQPGGASTSTLAGGLPDCPLPPQTRRLLSVVGGAEGQMVGFTGPGPVEAWMRFYDEWVRGQEAAGKGTAGAIAWQPAAQGWSGRWRSPATEGARPVEISWHLTPDPQPAAAGNWLGVLDLIPVFEPRGTP